MTEYYHLFNIPTLMFITFGRFHLTNESASIEAEHAALVEYTVQCGRRRAAVVV